MALADLVRASHLGRHAGVAARELLEQVHGLIGRHARPGSRRVGLLAHPRTLRELGAGFEAALADLRYGCIAVNTWTGLGFLTPTASWGAFPGHTLDNVQSGIGIVHNALLLDGPERTVVRGPFRPSPRSIFHGEWAISPKPPWFVTNRTAATTGRRLTRSRPTQLDQTPGHLRLRAARLTGPAQTPPTQVICRKRMRASIR